MTEQELRALVRDAIAKHIAGGSPTFGAVDPLPFVRQHASHGLVTLPIGMDSDGPCLIEPTVTCNHCGYCKSLGH